MNPEKRQSPSTPFSSLHEDDGLITPWREIKRGVQRLTGRIAPDEDEESAKPADQRSHQHTRHQSVRTAVAARAEGFLRTRGSAADRPEDATCADAIVDLQAWRTPRPRRALSVPSDAEHHA